MPGLQSGDPVLERMKEIIHSPEGLKAAEEAAAAGLPAMVRIDPLLKKELGSKYRNYDQGPQRAGWEVGQMLQKMGYKKHGLKACPEGCLCRRAAVWLLS